MQSFSFQNIDSFVTPPSKEADNAPSTFEDTMEEELIEVVIADDPQESEEPERPMSPTPEQDPVAVVEELPISPQPEPCETKKEKYKVLILLNYTTGSSLFPIENIDQDIFLIESKTNQSKWKNVCWFLENHNMWMRYEYVWIPDQNVRVTQEEITRFVNTVYDNSMTIAQPSLFNKKKSYIHKVLMHKPRSKARKSHFVENRLVCFKRSFIEEHLLDFLKANREQLETGWGIDMWWSFVHADKGLYVVDDVRVENVQNDMCVKLGQAEMKHYVEKYKMTLKI
jgi:hypothetical protein